MSDEIKKTVRRVQVGETELEIITLEPGDTVLCDSCSKDFSDSDEPGGLLFQSKAIGPCCQDRWEANIAKFKEQKYIRGRCPAGKSFRAWVLEDLR